MIKILHLVLYSDGKHYNQMYDILNNFYKHYENNDNDNDLFVKTYFYKYNNTITNNIEFIDNIIHVKGKESIVPGILEKTLSTFKYIQKEFQEDNYDYIVRSNISTIINFKLLAKELESTPVEYYGGLAKYKIDINSDINYIVGTHIILSKKGYNLLLNNVDLINMDIQDDISIGILFNKLNITLKLLSPKMELVPYYQENVIDNIKQLILNNTIIYRNKTYIYYIIDGTIDYNVFDIRRDIDVEQMKIISSLILCN